MRFLQITLILVRIKGTQKITDISSAATSTYKPRSALTPERSERFFSYATVIVLPQEIEIIREFSENKAVV